MTSLPHPVPSRIAHHMAALYGHEDATLLAWQRCCVQAAEALHAPHAGERLTKALALAAHRQPVGLVALSRSLTRQCYAPSSSSRAFASWRSAVSKPSVNQP